MQKYQNFSIFVDILQSLNKMFMYGLITLPLAPVRIDADHRSEMISQLLFGEYAAVITQVDNWVQITSSKDNITGWIDKKMLTIISEAALSNMQSMLNYPLHRPYNIIYNIRKNQTMLIPGGSIIYDPDGDDFKIGSEKWSLIDPVEKPELPCPVHRLLEIANQYMNTPFLLGGKTILGLDCSGFVQVVFGISGYTLPRFVADQVEEGSIVDFITEAVSGDLAFFQDENGQLEHVGILIDNNKIIHVSGSVRIDMVDSQGIINADGGYTHYLRVIKRIIQKK